MGAVKFILTGQDKKQLSQVKNVLSSNGYVYVGYCSDPMNLMRHVRGIQPELLVLEVSGGFRDLRQIIEVVDDELLSACILLLESRNDEVFEFLRGTRVVSYVTKPVTDYVLFQIADMSMANFFRVREYESKLKQLSNTLENRKIIEKAKWLLVEKEGYTETEAYNVIRKKSRDNRIAMHEVAEAIILAMSCG